MSVQMLTALKNSLNISTHAHQKQFLKLVYGVSGPHATSLANLLCLSAVKRQTDALAAHKKRYMAIVNRLSRILDAARANNIERELIQQLQD